MSTIELIVLGFLLEEGSNAYVLAKNIEASPASKFMKISIPAIYKTCKKLHAEGYLNGDNETAYRGVSRMNYSINSKGVDYFHALMEHFSGSIPPFYLELNAFLGNIDKLDKEKGKELLRSTQSGLIKWKSWIIQHEKESQHMPYKNRMIIMQYRMMLITLVEWIDIVIIEFERESNT